MAQFDVLEAGFSSLDETINFGMRAMGGNTNLHEVVTIAVISSSDTNKVSDPVKIISQIQSEKIFFSTDKMLRIMKDKNLTDEIGYYEFDYIIDNFCVSSCGRFMLACTQEGKITIRTVSYPDEEDTSEISNEFPIVFEENLDDYYIGEYYKGIFFQDNTFYIVTCKGLVKKFVLNEDGANDLFKSEVIFDLNTSINICAFKFPFFCLEGNEFSILNVNTQSCESDDAIGIKNLHAVESYFVAYDKMGNIYRILPNEVLIFCVNRRHPDLVDRFHDLLFIGNGEQENEVNFLGINREQNKLELISYPAGPEIVYTVALQGPINLVTAEEDVLFFTEIRKDNILLEIRLQIIIKADPEFRLKKLLMKQLFDEAEQFAKTFNLSSKIIAQAKAEYRVNKMVCDIKDIDQLLGILDTIDDQLFKLKCCDAVNCCSATDTRRVLCYGAFMDIGVKDSNENKDNVLLLMKIDFNDKLHRFDTFMQVNEKYDHCKWEHFVRCDLIDETKKLLQKGKIDKAAQVFSRLDRITIKGLSALKLEPIFLMLNRDLLTETSFLHIFITISLKYVPDSISIFVKWLHDRVLRMERQIDFPECAIRFVDEVTNLMNLSASIKKHLNIEDLQDPTRLLRSLEDLQIFLQNFGIKFPLSEYLNNPFIAIRTLINANHDIPNFEALMVDFLCSFVSKNNLDMDILLLEEIKNLIEYDEKYWVRIVPVLLKFINIIDKKLDLVYKILEITDMPWSNSVKDIARMICQLAPNTPGAERIAKYLKYEQRWIILRKYNIPKTQFETLDDKLFCFNRIIYLNEPSFLEDIHNLCLNDEVQDEADLLIINKLIVKQSYEEAMNILDDNKPDRIVALSKQILNRCLFYAREYDVPKKYRDPYPVVLNLIWNRLTKHATSLNDKRRFEFDYKMATAIYGISDNFKMQIKYTDLTKRKERDALLATLVQEVTDAYSENDTVNIEAFTCKCKKIANYFDIDVEDVFMECLNNNKTFNASQKLGQYILDTTDCPKLLSCWALCLLKYFKNSIDDCDESLSSLFASRSKNHEDYLVGIRLAKRLAIKAMMNATAEDYFAVMEVVQWVDNCFYVSDLSNPLKIDSFQIYRDKNACSEGSQTIQEIKMIFNNYCNILGSYTNPWSYLRYFTTNVVLSEDQFNTDMERITLNINNLLKGDHLLTCYNIINTIQQGFLCNYNCPMSKNALTMLQSEMTTHWLPTILEAVVSHIFIDKNLLCNLIFFCDQEQLLNYLKIYKSQPEKLTVLAQVGLEWCEFHGESSRRMNLINIVNLCKWWSRLTDKTIKYEYFFSTNCEDLLETLILRKEVNFTDLSNYCMDFSLDEQKMYLKYFELTLKSWDGNEKLEEQCQNVLKYISDTNKVRILIDEMWPSVNYYHYEVFEVLLSIHNKLSSTKNILFDGYRQLLPFLKTYKRVSSPTRYEIEKWFGTFPMKAFIDPLSETRLPLMHTFFSNDIWTIIKPEVNLDTYKDWLGVIPIIRHFLNTNDICTYAISTALPAGVTSSCNTWEFYPKHEQMIAKVVECAKYMTDMERATAALYTLMYNMTPGCDKVRMSELSYQYAQIYRQNGKNDAVEKVYLKVKQLYFNYSAMHILHKYQLAEDEYLNLVAEPLVLVSTLYNDQRIPKQISSLHLNCPDINHAVDELCILFDLTVKKIKFGELVKFLKSDSTLDLDGDRESDCLLRAYYICKGTDFHKSLLKIGLNTDDVYGNMSLRANSLKCFWYSSDINFLEAMSGMSREQFWAYTNKISVMAKLEVLGFKLKNISELDQSTKNILKQLTLIDTPLAIKCIAKICIIYEFDDLNHWKFIVNSSIRFNLIKDLCDYVEYLRFRCETDFIQNAWNTIISDAFKTDTNYIKALRLLQTCPVIYELNIEECVEKCISNRRLDIAAVLLQYMAKEKCDSYLKIILASDSIFEDIAELQNEVLGIDRVVKILESYNTQ